MCLAVISTHPIQYQAPVYRLLQSQFGISTTVIYGSDFSIAGYQDREFGTTFAWDTDLLQGYKYHFLSRVATGGAASDRDVSAKGTLAKLREICPSAILLLGYRSHFDLRAFWAARQIGCPLLFRAEAADHNRQRSRLKQWIRDAFLRWYYRQFAQILYIGKNALNHYKRLGCRDEQLVFSPYCVETGIFKLCENDQQQLREETRRELGIASDQYVLLMSGKLVPRKAPDHLLQAVKCFPESLRKHLVAMFLGDGEMRQYLQYLAAQEPYIETRFVGFQNQSGLSRYYHAADLLIVPSTEQETWGLVVNEALQHGLPCIVSDRVGCMPDLIKSGITGEVFSAGSPTALAEAIQRGLNLLNIPHVHNYCRDIVNHYTVEKAAHGIVEAYSKAISQ